MMKRIVGDDSSFLSSVEFQAEWRGRKAAEYPDDERNVASAEALEALAAWIRDHLDAPVLGELNTALDRLYEDPDNVFSFAPGISQRLGRYGFHRGAPEPTEKFLDGLVADIEEYLAGREASAS